MEFLGWILAAVILTVIAFTIDLETWSKLIVLLLTLAFDATIIYRFVRAYRSQ